MLKSKKINAKKMIMYFIIMLVMFGGSIFFLYKNYKLTVGNKFKESRDLFEKEYGELGIVGDGGQEVDVNGYGKNMLDINIFNDPKYSKLKDNTPLKTSEISIGKQNPFEAK